MNKQELEGLWQNLCDTGVIKNEQHVILSSGLHTKVYANFVSANIPKQLRVQLLGWVVELTSRAITEYAAKKIVFLGVGCGYWYAAQAAQSLWCDSVYAEKDYRGGLRINRDQGLALAGKSVIIVDDVCTEGTTLENLIRLANDHGGTPIACTVFLNRSGREFLNPDGITVMIYALFNRSFPTWVEKGCPMCQAGIPFSTQHGKGAEVFHLKGQPQPKS